jgi:hypothetical protein
MIVAALVLAGCAPAGSTLTPGGAQDGGQAVIVFERGGGIAGIHEVWTVYADGATASAEGAGQAVAAAEVEAVMAEADRLGFWEMEAAYGANDQCADCFTYNLTLTWEGRTKTVTTMDAASDAPPELSELLTAVSQLVAKAQGD